MITCEEIDILLTPEVRASIEANIECDPLAVALDKNLPYASLVATQVKYLRRAKAKLPSYYAARCIIPSLAFEQSSGEEAAFRRKAQGETALDLTCGLGVDSYALSGKFGKILSVEKNSVLAYLAKVNFRLLGADNIEVINFSAEEFIRSNPDLCVDLVFIDPDRRNAGKKAVALGDCSPDVTCLMRDLRRMSRSVMIKLSPLFDVAEAFSVFGNAARVEVASVRNECKEVLVETGETVGSPVISAWIAGFGEIEYPYEDGRRVDSVVSVPGEYKYMVAPDVALTKARISRRYFTESGFAVETDNSYAFTNDLPASFPGKAYRIERVEPFIPGKLKKILKETGIKRADIYKHNFPYETSAILNQLGIKEGGTRKIAFTHAAGELWAIFIADI